MDKLTHKDKSITEDSDTFIKRLSDSDDDFMENTYDGYEIELEDQSYDP